MTPIAPLITPFSASTCQSSAATVRTPAIRMLMRSACCSNSPLIVWGRDHLNCV